MARRAKVAFIDCGIHPAFVPDGVGLERLYADRSGVHVSDAPGEIGHGTHCFHVFKNHSKAPYDLVDIKVLDTGTGTGYLEALVVALDWCKDKSIDVINMSMGTRQFTDFAPLQEAVNALPEGTVIVSACSNTNELTAPAFFGRVAGVRHAKHGSSITYFQDAPGGIDFNVSTKELNFSLGGAAWVPVHGTNSFAAPVVAAEIANLVCAGAKNSKEAKQELERLTKSLFPPDYLFCKSLFPIWRHIDVPIVAAQGGMERELACLTRLFVDEGYRPICLTDREGGPEGLFSFRLQVTPGAALEEKMQLHFNLATPDIIFLSLSENELRRQSSKPRIEAYLAMSPDGAAAAKLWGAQCVIWGLSVNELFNKLIAALS